jgi:hypothetical protein
MVRVTPAAVPTEWMRTAPGTIPPARTPFEHTIVDPPLAVV